MVKIISSGKALHSPEFHTKKKEERRSRFWIVLIVVLVLVGAVVLVLRLRSLQVTNIEVLGASASRTEEVTHSIETALVGNYLWLIPHRNTLLLPRKKILAQVVTDTPRINSVQLNLTDLNTLTISIEERLPYGLYCLNHTDFIQSNCYFLDQDGFIFARSPAFSGYVYFIYSRPMEGEPLRQYFLPPTEFAKLRTFVEGAKTLNIESRALEIEGDKYVLVLSGDARIIWNSNSEPEKVLSNLEAFLTSDIVAGDKEFFNQLQYIDLTVGNKVFYKLNNSTPQ
jgi:hypothetical protein